MSKQNDIVLGSVSFSSAVAPDIIDRMAESIVDLLVRNGELEQERDFYKATATKLMMKRPHNGRRKN